jgi:hypothetical protein
VKDLGVIITNSPGRTPDLELNVAHRDLSALKARQLVDITYVMLQSEYQILLQAEIWQRILEAVKEGRIPRKSVRSSSLQKQLELES